MYFSVVYCTVYVIIVTHVVCVFVSLFGFVFIFRLSSKPPHVLSVLQSM